MLQFNNLPVTAVSATAPTPGAAPVAEGGAALSFAQDIEKFAILLPQNLPLLPVEASSLPVSPDVEEPLGELVDGPGLSGVTLPPGRILPALGAQLTGSSAPVLVPREALMPIDTGVKAVATPPVSGGPAVSLHDLSLPGEDLIAEVLVKERVVPVQHAAPGESPGVKIDAVASTFNTSATPSPLLESVSRPAISTSSAVAVHDRNFAQVLSDRLVMLAKDGVQVATIKLNPPQLGQLDVRITIDHSHTSISFGVQHDATKDALEQALPRLREAFASSGLSLGDTQVQSQAKHFADHSGLTLSEGITRAETEESVPSGVSSVIRASLGLIDQYV